MARKEKGKANPDAACADKDQPERSASSGPEGACPDTRPCGVMASSLVADAPEFVPLAASRYQTSDPAAPARREKKKKKDGAGRRAEDASPSILTDYNACQSRQPFGALITTVTACVAPEHDTASLLALLESWGLQGTFDFLFLPMDQPSRANVGYAHINFIDPAFVLLFCWVYQECLLLGPVTPAGIQGLDENSKHWAAYAFAEVSHFQAVAGAEVQGLGFRPLALPPERVFIEMIESGSWAEQVGVVVQDELVVLNGRSVSDMTDQDMLALKKERPLHLTFVRTEFSSQPVTFTNPVPSQWAVNTTNVMLSPQFREQFRKTKLCIFHSQGRCEAGANCPFAHSQDDLQPPPDLAKTKLCCNYFRGSCSDQWCKFAHGSQELKAGWTPGTPAMCFFGASLDAPGAWYVPMEDQLQGGVMLGFPGMEGHPVGAGGEADALGVPHFGEVPAIGELQPLVPDQSSSTLSENEQGESDSPGASGSRRHLSRAMSDLPPGTHHGGGLLSECAVAVDQVGSQSASSSLQRPVRGQSVVVREWGTFMESLQFRDDEEMPLGTRRCWSDSDLPAFREALSDLA